jgi:hypothetical protein
MMGLADCKSEGVKRYRRIPARLLPPSLLDQALLFLPDSLVQRDPAGMACPSLPELFDLAGALFVENTGLLLGPPIPAG